GGVAGRLRRARSRLSVRRGGPSLCRLDLDRTGKGSHDRSATAVPANDIAGRIVAQHVLDHPGTLVRVCSLDLAKHVNTVSGLCGHPRSTLLVSQSVERNATWIAAAAGGGTLRAPRSP